MARDVSPDGTETVYVHVSLAWLDSMKWMMEWGGVTMAFSISIELRENI